MAFTFQGAARIRCRAGQAWMDACITKLDDLTMVLGTWGEGIGHGRSEAYGEKVLIIGGHFLGVKSGRR